MCLKGPSSHLSSEVPDHHSLLLLYIRCEKSSFQPRALYHLFCISENQVNLLFFERREIENVPLIRLCIKSRLWVKLRKIHPTKICSSVMVSKIFFLRAGASLKSSKTLGGKNQTPILMLFIFSLMIKTKGFFKKNLKLV